MVSYLRPSLIVGFAAHARVARIGAVAAVAAYAREIPTDPHHRDRPRDGRGMARKRPPRVRSTTTWEMKALNAAER